MQYSRYNLDQGHYAFGQNWAKYARYITEHDIQKAEVSLTRLIDAKTLQGKTFLDIGCGSGLHSLAALRQGVARLTAFDIDPDSVKTTHALLAKHSAHQVYTVMQSSILHPVSEFAPEPYDVVYSWGSLHHTGDMRTALRHAASCVAPQGLLAVSIYKKTKLCTLWRAEKKLYSTLGRIPVLGGAGQRFLEGLYLVLFTGVKLLLRQNPFQIMRHYSESRGMHFMSDIRDWLGGYPYESATLSDVRSIVEPEGFELIKSFNADDVVGRGVIGTGCAEYVFRKL